MFADIRILVHFDFGRLLLLEKVYPWKPNFWAGNLALNSLICLAGTETIYFVYFFGYGFCVVYLQEGSRFASKRGMLEEWVLVVAEIWNYWWLEVLSAVITLAW